MSAFPSSALGWMPGIPIVKTRLLENGVMMRVGATDGIGLPTYQILLGTRPYTEAELVVRRLVVEVFGLDWLKDLGVWKPSAEEVLEDLRSLKKSRQLP